TAKMDYAAIAASTMSPALKTTKRSMTDHRESPSTSPPRRWLVSPGVASVSCWPTTAARLDRPIGTITTRDRFALVDADAVGAAHRQRGRALRRRTRPR